MWNLIEFQCGNSRGQEQPRISYRILSLDDMDITIKRKPAGSTKMKAINWLEGVDFNVKARAPVQDVNTKPLHGLLRLPAALQPHCTFYPLKYR
jgi:hypothetical protein